MIKITCISYKMKNKFMDKTDTKKIKFHLFLVDSILFQSSACELKNF